MPDKMVSDLKDVFKQAAEIAAQVPESMQQAAFNRAVDMLTGQTRLDSGGEPREPKHTRKVNTPPADVKSKEQGDAVQLLLGDVDSTRYPNLTSALGVLERSLMLLQIALNDHKVDGLTPGEIARVLTDKFRIRTGRTAVSMALGRATNLVNRVKNGGGFTYKIMAPGQEYLASLQKTEQHTPSMRHRTKTLDASSGPKSTESIASLKSEHKNDSGRMEATSSRSANGKTSSKIKSSSALGPKTAVLALVDGGFFSQGRTAMEVQDCLTKRRGFTFGIDQLRLVLLRLVRDEILSRDENSEGDYEYKKCDS